MAVLYPGSRDAGAARLSQASIAVMLAPSLPYGLTQMANLTDESHPIEMAVLTAIKKAFFLEVKSSLLLIYACLMIVGMHRISHSL